MEEALGMDFTTGRMMPKLLRFLLPFLLANLLNSIYNTVDTIVIGQFVGSAGTVAVSLGGKMMNLFTFIGLGLAGGGQILVAQLAGAKRREEFNAAIGTLLTLTVGSAAVFAAATLALSGSIIRWLNTPVEAAESALAYLRITAAGLPLTFGYNAVSSVLRGMGDSRRPLIFIAVAAGVNLVGDLAFIVLFDLGAAGTAIATVLGQGVSLAFSAALLYRRRAQFGFDFRLRSFRPDAGMLRIILKLGLPLALRNGFVSGTQLLSMGFVNRFGLTEAAAYSIGDKIYFFANIFTASVRQAGGSVVGQNFSAGKFDRVRAVVRDTAVLALSAAGVLCVLFLLFPRQIYGLFTPDEAVLAYAPRFLQITCLVFLLSAAMTVYDTVVTGTGFALLGMLSGFLDGVVFRLGFGYFFAFRCGLGVTGYFLAEATARLASLVLNGAYYYSGAWKRRKTLVNHPAG